MPPDVPNNEVLEAVPLPDPIVVQQYNKDIAEAMDRINKGEFTSQDDLERELDIIPSGKH